MNKAIREFSLPNGLSVSIYHHSHRYFGDYFRIRVEIICRIPLRTEFFTEDGALAQAIMMLGNEVVYTCIKEQMGVPSANLEKALEKLVASFSDNSLPYISSPQFPGNAVRAELKKYTGKRLMTPEF